MEQKVERNIGELSQEVVRVRDEFRNSFNNDHLLHREMISFKNDLDAIKGLLLNRLVFRSEEKNKNELAILFSICMKLFETVVNEKYIDCYEH